MGVSVLTVGCGQTAAASVSPAFGLQKVMGNRWCALIASCETDSDYFIAYDKYVGV